MVIQRSWKILSEVGSTSATSSSTDVTSRSPTGLQSCTSSDDSNSNCSNQTTHSMVTTVASPPTKLDAPPSTNTCVESAAVKFVTTPHMAETILQRLRQRLSSAMPTMAGGAGGANSESAMRSLELLRISVQNSFDCEINEVIQKFMENFFKPAINNIKENLGESAVSDDMLQKMSCALLENAKDQYNAFRIKPSSQTVYMVASNNTNAVTEQAARVAIKRPAAGATESANKFFTTTSSLPGAQLQSFAAVKAQLSLTSSSGTEFLQEQKIPFTFGPARRRIFWNTAQLSTATKFVLDVQANQAFGFGNDRKDRLASKHSELLRYLPNEYDRSWLVSQNIISEQNRYSRFLFLVYDELYKLVQSHEPYRTSPIVDLTLMYTFTVPDQMIRTMKRFFMNLNKKSRGLISSSSSVGELQSPNNSHLRNALLQGLHASSTVVSCGETSTSLPTSITAEGYNIAVITSSECSIPPIQAKPKSTLSSSHATLTALLNNSAGTI